MLTDQGNTRYAGLLQEETGGKLNRLSGNLSLSFKAVVPMNIREGDLMEYLPTGMNRVYITVYGFLKDGDLVCEVFDPLDLMLQPPRYYDDSLPYFNPLVSIYGTRYDRDGTFRNDYNLTGRVLPSYMYVPPRQRPTKDSNPRDTHAPRKDEIEKVFDSVPSTEVCSPPPKSLRLCTRLKQHQLEGLSMMMEKEKGILQGCQFGSLWNVHHQHDGRVSYRNNITKHTTDTKPPLCLGGLLADDMGLGKTLTTLALIATSLDQYDKGQSTLVVTQLSLLSTWETEIKRHLNPGTIKWHVHHGAKRKPVSNLKDYDIVLTTYETMRSEQLQGQTAQRGSVLHDMEWHRIVLDEVYPFDTTSIFDEYILSPLKEGKKQGMDNLRALARSISMRRTKAMVQGELQLGRRQDILHQVELTQEERRGYEILKKKFSTIFYAFSSTSGSNTKSTCAFQTILRLRHFCNHGLGLLPPQMVEIFRDHVEDNLRLTSTLIGGSGTCDNCQAPMGKQVERDPSDIPYREDRLCSKCLSSKQGEGRLELPDSMEDVIHEGGSVPDNGPEQPENMDYEVCANDVIMGDRPSSKVRALLENLRRDHETGQKSVIFSSWKQMLDLVAQALKNNHFKYEQIDGTIKPAQRNKSIEILRDSAESCILLASVGCCGVGIDLTFASRVHLMELLWSPMEEEQAIDRVHRMGQERGVIVTRYIVRNSIEEYIVRMQLHKSSVIRQAIDGSASGEVVSMTGVLSQFLEDTTSA
ncbi:hypothetical protein BO94DRAFT_578409 [Aspergillus sclerotioniger CBS 115572]|uniref:Uncharacterized protein n=1 Tax=Aspergillus sclerotioniger CBS 115572 TaxID=1450535 RepID=A0A317VFQ5_9EURO|nr:hypothetical protein BO94DRAFT_578409 [Aspergillus sclerotioniger CBS 115572]PWY73214.1 hypothetical protein BO94DRAFT_578409 [Aspergillus sclerotioniger CBS 115572]